MFLYFPSVVFVFPIPQFCLEDLTSPEKACLSVEGQGGSRPRGGMKTEGGLRATHPRRHRHAGLWRAAPGPPSGLRNGPRRRTTWKRKTGFGQENSRKKV